MTSAPAIGFEYRPSRWLRRALALFSVLALLSLWLSALPAPLSALLSLLLLGAAIGCVRRQAASPVLAAGWGMEGDWSLRLRDGSDVKATLMASRTLGEGAIWLALRGPSPRPFILLLAADNSDADIRRRLRMRLQLAPAQTVGPMDGTLSSPRGPRA
jgi:toxin CptA